MGRVRCVGAIVRDGTGRLLVVQRGHAPAAGAWSVPGGRVEAGESDADAVTREVREETGLVVRAGALVGTVERPAPAGDVYEIFDYAAELVPGPAGGSGGSGGSGVSGGSGDPVPGSDAADARWVTDAELLDLPCSPGLVETLRSWQQLP